MKNQQIKKILTASISFAQPASATERKLFSKRMNGSFYTFGLSSGQTFVVHIPPETEHFTLRTLEGPLPGLREIQWKRLPSIEDLNYQTNCVFAEGVSPTEQQVCLNTLNPRRNYGRTEMTKIAFKYYHYHPILERIICLQHAIQSYRIAEILLADRRTQIQALLISKKQPKPNQQQTKGEKQNVRN